MKLEHLHDAFKYQDDILYNGEIYKIIKMDIYFKTIILGQHDFENTVIFDDFLNKCKIIKRPIDNIANILFNNNESFIPAERLSIIVHSDISKRDLASYFVEYANINSLSVRQLSIFKKIDEDIDFLRKNHFDIDFLIESGLAISYDDLKNN